MGLTYIKTLKQQSLFVVLKIFKKNKKRLF